MSTLGTTIFKFNSLSCLLNSSKTLTTPGARVTSTGGFDYDFTNYSLKKRLEFQTKPLNLTPLARYSLNIVKGFSEITVGESIGESPYEGHAQKGLQALRQQRQGCAQRGRLEEHESVLVEIVRGPLFRGPLILSLYIYIYIPI